MYENPYRSEAYENLPNRCFYAPGLKDPPGASSNWIVGLSVIPPCLQTKCNILSFIK